MMVAIPSQELFGRTRYRYNQGMEDLAELRKLAGRYDEPIRHRLLRYIELRQKLTELTGDETLSEGTLALGLLYERHPDRREIVLTATRLRALGRAVFPKLDE